jgi:hypothetical protein
VRSHVMSANKLLADDTPVPVLAPGNGKTKTGRLWTYIRDDRPSGDVTAPAVWFAYSPDRKGENRGLQGPARSGIEVFKLLIYVNLCDMQSCSPSHAIAG